MQPNDLARARFPLPQALAADADPDGRAVAVAHQARDTYRDAVESSAEQLAEVRTWLDKHG